DLPRLETVGLDLRALVFALVAAVLTGLIFGTVPALRGTALSLSDTLKAGSRSVGGSGAGARSTLVVAQVALSLMLMLGSGLLLRSFLQLQGVDVGFDTQNLLIAEIQVPPGSYPDRAEAQQAWDEIQAALARLPGVRVAGGTDQLPVGPGGTWNGVYAQGREPDRTSDYLPGQRRFVTEGFLEVLGLPILAGRTFQTTDDRSSALATVINASMAEALWPGEDALGRYVVLPWDPPIPLEVIGIVGDLSDQGPALPPRPTFYLPIRQNFGGLGTMRFVMRTTGDPMIVAASVREAVWSVDSDLPVSGIHTMDDRIASSVNQPKFRATLVGLFAATALVLAALGLYAVLAYSVRQRTHEIAVRMAVGAVSRNVVLLVLRQGLRLVAIGVLLGVAGGLLGGRILQSFLFGVSLRDPVTLASVTATMIAVALLASLIPARRAVGVAPLEALNTE
ncbi:MAG: ABC transporter permease, partial [Gemmatimonadota bacterium]